jgi:hypothetical protein
MTEKASEAVALPKRTTEAVTVVNEDAATFTEKAKRMPLADCLATSSNALNKKPREDDDNSLLDGKGRFSRKRFACSSTRRPIEIVGWAY